eukprot:TRINITY_DN4880_c1_g4_i2.p1 TRINITY_DN4880_c1_g4~~TRINITY_DN4880_c1_g4_i2.p1  ORF type:complete len:413 (+),score=148.83 TRINITY_DN4880_c1_g4_i2:54-1292(+)
MSLAKMMEGGEEKSWKDFGLDARLLHGIKRMKFKTPTLIQSSTIPLALAGKDVLARASTGSGKTAAYSLPMCHKLLQSKGEEGKVRGLVLVPSKELCNQVMQHYQRVLAHAEGALCVVDLSDIDSAAEWSNQRCEICVATPSTALTHANAGHVDLSALEVCVIDEADALLSHPTVKRLRCMYPTTTQSFLMSATLSPGVVKLKGLILNKPVVVKLQEEDDDEDEEAGREAAVPPPAPEAECAPHRDSAVDVLRALMRAKAGRPPPPHPLRPPSAADAVSSDGETVQTSEGSAGTSFLAASSCVTSAPAAMPRARAGAELFAAAAAPSSAASTPRTGWTNASVNFGTGRVGLAPPRPRSATLKPVAAAAPRPALRDIDGAVNAAGEGGGGAKAPAMRARAHTVRVPPAPVEFT